MLLFIHSVKKTKVHPVYPCGIIVYLVLCRLVYKTAASETDAPIAKIFHFQQETFLHQSPHPYNQKIRIHFDNVPRFLILFFLRSEIAIPITHDQQFRITFLEDTYSLLNLFLS